MVAFDAPKIVIGAPGTVLRDGYFPYGWVDSYLPEPQYRALEASFIPPDTHRAVSTLGKGKKRILFVMPPVPGRLEGIDEVWVGFLTAISSLEFRAHCLDVVRKVLPLDGFAPGPYRELFRLRQLLEPDDTEMQCEFSNLGRGVYLPPHSDSSDKLLTFVYYFAPPGWQDEWGGSTNVYRPLKPNQILNFSNFFLTPETVEEADRCLYRPNRLFFFAKNDRAWHGVAPLSAETALPRHSFNFSLRFKANCRLLAEMEVLHAKIRASEQPAFV